MDTMISGIAISDTTIVTTTAGRITTEEGIAITTEDGREIIEESPDTPGQGGNLTFGGDSLTFGGQDVNQ